MRPISTNISEKPLILIVDDSMMNRALLADILQDEYDILEAEDGEQAIAVLQRRAADISLVVLDIVMPKLDGFGVLEAMNKNRWIQYIPVVAVSAETSPDFIERAYNLGVTDFINRPFDEFIVRLRANNAVKLYSKQRRLMDMVANEVYEKEKNSSLMVAILSHIVEFRNGESGLHVVNIGKITEILLNQINKHTTKYHLSYAQRQLITNASALHDIGKIVIDDDILNKPGKLTDEEFEHMKQHTVMGYNMLADLPFQDEPLLKVAREIVRWHHERYDGRGYPDGLKGDEIPISAQAVSLADVYDALTSERVYKPAFSHEKAIQMILNGECGTFNPMLLECLVETQDEIREALESSDTAFDNYKELDAITSAIQNAETAGVTEYALGLLETERQKNHFAIEVSREIQFHYNLELDILTIPEWAAKQYELPTAVPDPAHNETIVNAIGKETLELLRGAIYDTTLHDPLIRIDCRFELGGDETDCYLIAKSLWALEGEPHITGFAGKILRRMKNDDWIKTPFELSDGRGTTYIKKIEA